MGDTENSWHLDKRVPVALILTLAIQAVALGMWVGSLSSRQQEQERRLTTLEQQRFSERLAALEAQLADAKALLLRIDAKLERQPR